MSFVSYVISLSILFAPLKDTKSEAYTMITRRYAQFASALKRKDLNPIRAMLSKDFTFVDMGKPRDTEYFIEALHQALPLIKEEYRQYFRITAFTTAGRNANAKVSFIVSTLRKRKNGQLDKMESVSVFEDSWVQIKSKWYLHKSTYIAVQFYRNGKRIHHSSRTGHN